MAWSDAARAAAAEARKRKARQYVSRTFHEQQNMPNGHKVVSQTRLDMKRFELAKVLRRKRADNARNSGPFGLGVYRLLKIVKNPS